jgi:hypothetical protein
MGGPVSESGTGDATLDLAIARRDTLIAYCASAMNAGDWHAVSDAANDIRCMEVELRYLWASLESRKAKP